MSNDDPKQSKTIMGWSPQAVTPGQPQPNGQPAWSPPGAQPGWPQQPQAQPPQPQWQQPPQAPQAPQQPWQQPPAAQPAWGQQPPQPAAQPAWGQQPPQPAAQPAWGQQPPAAQPAWGQQPPAAQPAWGQQPPQPAAQPWQQPAAQQPGWAPPAIPGMPSAMPSPGASSGRGIAGADATVGVSDRVRFIRLTYLHLFGAILAFVGLEWLLFHNETLIQKVTIPLTEFALGGRFNWGIVLAVFTGASIATHWLASQTKSRPLHYIGLFLYVLAEALIFVPLLVIVMVKTQDIIARGGGNPNILRDSAYITLGVFGALTATVMFSKKDFSFLKTALIVGGAAAMGLIVLSLVFGFNLGIVFAVAMVILASGQILYETSQIMAHCEPDQYVGAALSLFSSIALLFWYIIQIVMEMRD